MILVLFIDSFYFIFNDSFLFNFNPPTGTYSLKDPMNKSSEQACLPCLNNAFCGGGDQISPLPGFWRG